MQLKDIANGKSTSSFDKTSYSFGIFRMNTPEGIIWFTPGLTSGYITGMVYAPCQNVYFAYATNKAPARGLHAYMITSILHIIKNNQSYLKENVTQPPYCAKTKPAKRFIFPLALRDDAVQDA